MNTFCNIAKLAFGILAVLTFQANSVAQVGPVPDAAPGGPAGAAAPGRAGRSFTPDHPHSLVPYFTPATSSPKSPDKDGFLQRWLLL